MKQWYEELFSNYAKNYDNEPYTKGTLQEVDFLETEVDFNKHINILDIGCGTGRHSIELAKRGYQVTGIDLSANMLNRAKEKAREAKVDVQFFQSDARNFHFDEKFEMVLMLCEGGFSLMETDEMNFAILKNAASCVAPGGKLVFNCLNALFPLFHSVKEFMNSENPTYYDGAFDLMQFRDFSINQIEDDDGKQMELKCNERYYVPSEIQFMLKLLDFNSIDIFGCKIGDFQRNRRLNTDDFQMLVIAQK
ncbi:MAG: class I SAM-dependent methyltransferase [Prolixibacteraceae bacterium]